MRNQEERYGAKGILDTAESIKREAKKKEVKNLSIQKGSLKIPIIAQEEHTATQQH